MSFSDCPFCHNIIPSSELEWHADNHFVEEEFARDMELAQQVALTSTSPRIADNQMNDTKAVEFFSGGTPETSTSRCNGKTSNHGERCNQEKISCLVSVQIRSTFYKVEGGLMALLRRCLELESRTSISIITGHVDHFQSVESEDSGWGCGWRNIQMLSSNLLMQRLEAKEVMFGGSGFVPDIPSLQRWLEIAWERDFDIPGSVSFNHKIYGSTKWIGTTECATLFRSFGLQARIVDFGSKEIKSFFSVHGANPWAKAAKQLQINGKGKREIEQVYGPMDKFLLSRHHGVLQADHVRHGKSSNIGIHSGNDLGASIHRKNNDNSSDHDKLNKCLTRKTKGHQVLIDWIWNYFADKKFNKSGNLEHVIVSEKTPLYFQHDGHSRTIVGIQVKQQQLGMPKQYNLLVLDPGLRTEALERSLRENVGWQKLIKRGVHTMKKPQYQLCYIDPGIAHGEAMEQLKTIDSIFFES